MVAAVLLGGVWVADSVMAAMVVMEAMGEMAEVVDMAGSSQPYI